MKLNYLFLITSFLLFSCSTVKQSQISHGPILGKISSDGVAIWARTDIAGEFYVTYGTDENNLSLKSTAVKTVPEKDNTGVIYLKNLDPGQKYFFIAHSQNSGHSERGSFTTLENSERLKSKLNPEGLFNFNFEFACGNNQHPNNGLGPSMPVYDTLNTKFRDEVNFVIHNGDFIYEENREFSPKEWQEQTGSKELPKILETTPHLSGVWENYKTYIARAPNLMEWHRNIPAFFTFDDHELVNDIIGAGTEGYRSRRAVFRDIGVQGWYDYLGWANPTETKQKIHFGKAKLNTNSDILFDPDADFSKIDLEQASNLHVHWGDKDAGNMDGDNGDFKGGDPNARVYSIVKVIDKNRVQISPPAQATGTAGYSIGRYSYSTFKIANCRFLLLDTKSHRDVHDIKNPAKKGISMLGKKQRDWLMDVMSKKDADFYFVVSSVNFMVPHVGGGGGTNQFAATKDDAWTVFFDEREKLLDFWDGLNKKVFILSGDLHNSYAVKITDSVWEFASGPHNSVNHRPSDEGGRPANGPFKYGPRACDIRWSTTALDDIPRVARKFPHFCVVQVNNVFNNPQELGGKRLIAFPKPHVIFKFYDALTGKLQYAEPVHANETDD
ncbi:MAG: alkaline phosphatase D family protein [Lentisphaeraceae bacterium]|nr:alkaline phosphatase D family protein [Lentisphaeraceae bacterium]